jgi:hypothetical protein
MEAAAATTNPTYRRVATSSNGNDSNESTLQSNYEWSAAAGRKSISERLVDKGLALAWILLALLVAWWSRFYHVLLANKNSLLLEASASCFGITAALALYLLVYLPYGKGLTDSSAWGVYCPRVIPAMIGMSIVGVLLLIRGVWHEWGFLSPLIIAIQFLGALFSLHFVPWCC